MPYPGSIAFQPEDAVVENTLPMCVHEFGAPVVDVARNMADLEEPNDEAL